MMKNPIIAALAVIAAFCVFTPQGAKADDCSFKGSDYPPGTYVLISEVFSVCGSDGLWDTYVREEDIGTGDVVSGNLCRWDGSEIECNLPTSNFVSALGGTLTSGTISGGTINNATIGGTTPAPITATNLTVTGTVTGIDASDVSAATAAQGALADSAVQPAALNAMITAVPGVAATATLDVTSTNVEDSDIFGVSNPSYWYPDSDRTFVFVSSANWASSIVGDNTTVNVLIGADAASTAANLVNCINSYSINPSICKTSGSYVGNDFTAALVGGDVVVTYGEVGSAPNVYASIQFSPSFATDWEPQSSTNFSGGDDQHVNVLDSDGNIIGVFTNGYGTTENLAGELDLNYLNVGGSISVALGVSASSVSSNDFVLTHGDVYSAQYCDENGINCVTAAELYDLVHP